MATREKDGQNQSESTSRDMWKHGMEAGLAYVCLGRRSQPGCHSPLQRNGSWGSYQRGDALCGREGLPHFACPWPCQSAGDQISKLIALPGKVFSSLPECVIVCTCVQRNGSWGSKKKVVMRGHAGHDRTAISRHEWRSEVRHVPCGVPFQPLVAQVRLL